MNRVATPISDHAHQKMFSSQLLIFMNLYQHAKNQAIFFNLFWRYS